MVSNAEKSLLHKQPATTPKPNKDKDFRAMRVYENEVFQLLDPAKNEGLTVLNVHQACNWVKTR